MESRSLLGIRERKNQARSDQSQLGIIGDHGNVKHLLQQHNITERPLGSGNYSPSSHHLHHLAHKELRRGRANSRPETQTTDTHRNLISYMDPQRKLVSSILVYLCAETREQSTAFSSGLEGVLHKVSHVGALSVYVKLILISIGQSSPFISSQVHSIRCQVIACYIVVCQS